MIDLTHISNEELPIIGGWTRCCTPETSDHRPSQRTSLTESCSDLSGNGGRTKSSFCFSVLDHEKVAV